MVMELSETQFHQPHFKDEETEVQRDQEAAQGHSSKSTAEMGSELGSGCC